MELSGDYGLARYEQIDYHAILGVSIDATPAEIRKRYQRIARALHPDKSHDLPPETQQIGAQLLSRLVNPAYKKLSQDKIREEHLLILKLLGQRAAQNPPTWNTTAAQALAQTPHPEIFYQQTLEGLAQTQYEDVATALVVASAISELNLAYLAWKTQSGYRYAKSKEATVPPRPAAAPAPTPSASAAPPRPPMPPAGQAPPSPPPSVPPATPRPAAPPAAAVDPRERYIEQYYNRAVDYRRTKQYAQAHQELQDALKLDPNNCRCLNLRGQIYLEQKQPTMAKIQFERVLKLNPQDADAQEGMEVIARLKGQTGTNPNGTQSATAPPKAAKGGLFGLFGKGK